MSLDWLDDELANVAAAGLLRRRRVVRPLPHGRCEVDGRTLINFATNDYLDLASHPRVVEMAQQALAELGAGGRGSALIVGRTPWHDSLENRLARFEGTAAAILFPSGYAANVGTITALVGPDDAVFCDRLNHASLIDGCRLSRAKFHVYPHRDVSALDNILSKRSATASTATGARLPRRLIVTDSLFSMDGDIAPLRELVEVADRHEAMLLIDEAHATGVFATTVRSPKWPTSRGTRESSASER
ncbi:MAG: aminotransferase class I/II-fold pyridoxal phosphate-dependent enzyme [Planctomycetaceae bacterium]